MMLASVTSWVGLYASSRRPCGPCRFRWFYDGIIGITFVSMAKLILVYANLLLRSTCIGASSNSGSVVSSKATPIRPRLKGIWMCTAPSFPGRGDFTAKLRYSLNVASMSAPEDGCHLVCAYCPCAGSGSMPFSVEVVFSVSVRLAIALDYSLRRIIATCSNSFGGSAQCANL